MPRPVLSETINERIELAIKEQTRSELVEGAPKIKTINEMVREDPDFLCEKSKSILQALTAQSGFLIARGKLDRNFRVPLEDVAAIGLGIALALRVAVGADCGSPTIRVEPR